MTVTYIVHQYAGTKDDKPRPGRPKGDGTHRNIGVYGTEQEIAAVLELTPRQRMEAMLATIQPAQGKE
jgi:hypothetical protein